MLIAGYRERSASHAGCRPRHCAGAAGGQPLLPVQQAICRAAGDLLEDVRLFDVYRGAQAGEGKKSAAFAMTFRAPDRTLTEQEITALMDRIVRSVTAQFGAEVRS